MTTDSFIVVHGIHQGNIVLEDEWGQGEFPLSLLAGKRRIAENTDEARALVYGRVWTRDALIRADETAASLGLVELPSCVFCVDQAATTTDHRDKPVCLTHVPTEG